MSVNMKEGEVGVPKGSWDGREIGKKKKKRERGRERPIFCYSLLCFLFQRVFRLWNLSKAKVSKYKRIPCLSNFDNSWSSPRKKKSFPNILNRN
jgi:hypothetical protein